MGAIHLLNSQFCRLTIEVLNKTATLVGWDFHIDDFAEWLEESSELFFVDARVQTADKYGGVVGIVELVLVGEVYVAHTGMARESTHSILLAFWCSGRNTNRSATAKLSVHFSQGSLLF